MDKTESTPERRLLDGRPGLRSRVRSDPAFATWRKALKKVLVDDEELSVVGGDRLMDEDQLIVEWAGRFRRDLLEQQEKE